LTVACRWRFRGDVSKEGVILIVFTIALGIDLSQVDSLIKTGITVAAVLAALAFFDLIADVALLLSLIALLADV
jgi:hypothetical protein